MRLRGVLAIATIIAGAVVTTPVRAVTKWLCGNPGFPRIALHISGRTCPVGKGIA